MHRNTQEWWLQLVDLLINAVLRAIVLSPAPPLNLLKQIRQADRLSFNSQMWTHLCYARSRLTAVHNIITPVGAMHILQYLDAIVVDANHVTKQGTGRHQVAKWKWEIWSGFMLWQEPWKDQGCFGSGQWPLVTPRYSSAGQESMSWHCWMCKSQVIVPPSNSASQCSKSMLVLLERLISARTRLLTCLRWEEENMQCKQSLQHKMDSPSINHHLGNEWVQGRYPCSPFVCVKTKKSISEAPLHRIVWRSYRKTVSQVQKNCVDIIVKWILLEKTSQLDAILSLWVSFTVRAEPSLTYQPLTSWWCRLPKRFPSPLRILPACFDQTTFHYSEACLILAIQHWNTTEYTMSYLVTLEGRGPLQGVLTPQRRPESQETCLNSRPISSESELQT